MLVGFLFLSKKLNFGNTLFQVSVSFDQVLSQAHCGHSRALERRVYGENTPPSQGIKTSRKTDPSICRERKKGCCSSSAPFANPSKTLDSVVSHNWNHSQRIGSKNLPQIQCYEFATKTIASFRKIYTFTLPNYTLRLKDKQQETSYVTVPLAL